MIIFISFVIIIVMMIMTIVRTLLLSMVIFTVSVNHTKWWYSKLISIFNFDFLVHNFLFMWFLFYDIFFIHLFWFSKQSSVFCWQSHFFFFHSSNLFLSSCCVILLFFFTSRSRHVCWWDSSRTFVFSTFYRSFWRPTGTC